MQALGSGVGPSAPAPRRACCAAGVWVAQVPSAPQLAQISAVALQQMLALVFLLLASGMAEAAAPDFSQPGPCAATSWLPEFAVPDRTGGLPARVVLNVTLPVCPADADADALPFGPAPFPVLFLFNGFQVGGRWWGWAESCSCTASIAACVPPRDRCRRCPCTAVRRPCLPLALPAEPRRLVLAPGVPGGLLGRGDGAVRHALPLHAHCRRRSAAVPRPGRGARAALCLGGHLGLNKAGPGSVANSASILPPGRLKICAVGGAAGQRHGQPPVRGSRHHPRGDGRAQPRRQDRLPGLHE